MAARSAFRLVHAANAGAPRLAGARGKPLLARPMGAVAIRLPERMSSQLFLVVPQAYPRGSSFMKGPARRLSASSPPRTRRR